jgi:hypothetical protein
MRAGEEGSQIAGSALIGNATGSIVTRSGFFDAPSISRPTNAPSASKSALKPSAISRVSAPGRAASSM